MVWFDAMESHIRCALRGCCNIDEGLWMKIPKGILRTKLWDPMPMKVSVIKKWVQETDLTQANALIWVARDCPCYPYP